MEIALKPLEISDFDQLINWIPSKKFHVQWCGSVFKYPFDEDQFEKYLQKCGGQPPKRLAFKVIDSKNNKMIGQSSFHIINLEQRSAHLGPILVGDSSLRGRGIGRQIVDRMLEIGFRQLKLHRIDLYVFDFNESAIACYEKSGFTKEGLLRDATKLDDEYWSPYVMGILESEWRAR